MVSRTRRGVSALPLVCVLVVPACGPQAPGASEGARPGRPVDLPALVDRAIRTATERASLSTRRNTPWELLHAALGLGGEATVRDGDSGRAITLLEYFERGGPYFDEPIYTVGPRDAKVRRSRHAAQIQRHPNQFVAYFAQMGLPPETELRAGDRRFTIADLLATSRRLYDPGEENTFTLIAWTLYCESDRPSRNEFGQVATISGVAARELAAKPAALACGGAHTALALGLALRKFGGGSEPVQDVWKAVARRQERELRHVRSAQGADGRLPFPVPEASLEAAAELGADGAAIYGTGHTLEWLIATLPDAEFDSDWVRRAVRYLAESVVRRASDPPPASPWFHAVHALRMYRERSRSHPDLNTADGLEAVLSASPPAAPRR